MVEVDPTLIIAAAVTIVGIAAVAICSKPKEQKEDRPNKKKEKAEVAQTATPTQLQSKPKKKARSKAKSKAKSEAVEPVHEKLEAQSTSKAATDESSHVRFDDEEKKPKKKNKQKVSVISTSKKPIAAVAESTAEEDSTDADSSDEDVAIVSVDIPKRPASPLLETIVSPPSPTASFAHSDGWAVVEDKRKLKLKKPDFIAVDELIVNPVVEETPAVAVAPPVIESVSSEIRVDAKKLGLLIGSKGATRNAIQNATGTSIQMPKAEKDTVGTVAVTVSGSAAGVNKAITAMNELCIKGYCALLAADDFQESYVAVHPKYLSEIIGKGGSTIKALTAHTGVKITIPPTVSKTINPDGKAAKVKVGLAGPKEKVSLARSLIKDITKYFHTPVTHPNLTHSEMPIAENYFNFIIGGKGSEIKHIQNSYKVSVHIPDEDSANSNVVIVGSEAAVSQAKRHIEKIIDRVNGVTEKVAVESAPNLEPSSIGLSSSVTSSEHQDPVGGSWVSESPSKSSVHVESAPITSSSAEEAWYTSTTTAAPVDLNRVLPTNTKFASLPINVSGSVDSKPLASSAWNNISSLANDKW